METEYFAVVLNPNSTYPFFNDVAKVKAIASIQFEAPMPTSKDDVYDLILKASQQIYGQVAVSIGLRSLNMDDFESELNSADYHMDIRVSYPRNLLYPVETINVHSRWNNGKGIMVRVYPTSCPEKSDTLSLQAVCSFSEYDIKNHSFIKIREY